MFKELICICLLFIDISKSKPFKSIAGVVNPIVKLGLFIFAFSASWFNMVVEKLGSLLIAVLISCKVFNKDGELPIRFEIEESTYDVLAIWRLFEFTLGVGTCGIPENIGEIIKLLL